MSYTTFENEDGSTFDWKDCVVPGCPNQVCLGVSPVFCHPHALRGGCEPPVKTVALEHALREG